MRVDICYNLQKMNEFVQEYFFVYKNSRIGSVTINGFVHKNLHITRTDLCMKIDLCHCVIGAWNH